MTGIDLASRSFITTNYIETNYELLFGLNVSFRMQIFMSFQIDVSGFCKVIKSQTAFDHQNNTVILYSHEVIPYTVFNYNSNPALSACFPGTKILLKNSGQSCTCTGKQAHSH